MEPKARTIEGLGTYARIRHAAEGQLRNLHVEEAALIFVRRGRKIVHATGNVLVAGPGEAIVLDRDVTIDLRNANGEDGSYEAEVMAFDRDILAEFHEHHGTAGAVRHDRIWRYAPPRQFSLAFDAVRNVFEETDAIPDAVARHRLDELLIWLAEAGIRLSSDLARSLPLEVRRCVGRDCQRQWRPADIAGALAMSEPTLRRRLRGFGVTVTDIIADVRMTKALFLLQATDQPIAEIAYSVGYDSPSKFAARFRSRFGAAPNSIRKKAGDSDRDGIEIDRDGRARAA